MSNEIVRKASGAIHITHAINLVDQQLWNLLLANAYPNLSEKEIFSIPMKTILTYFGTDNYLHIKESLRKLTTTAVEYNLFEKDMQKWGVCPLLSLAEIENGTCFYRYTPELKEKLNNPKIFAKISLIIQRKFSSKYSLFLYEFCYDYKGINATPWVTVENLKKYLGIDKKEYIHFKEFNKFVLQNSLRELNSNSDLKIEFEFKRNKRKISEVKFYICEKKEENQTIEYRKINDVLKELTLSEKSIKLITEKYTEDQINQAIQVLKNSHEVKNAEAFLHKALKEGWQVRSVDPKTTKDSSSSKKTLETPKTAADSTKQLQSVASLDEFKNFLKNSLSLRDYEAWLDQLILTEISMGRATFAGLAHPLYRDDILRNYEHVVRQALGQAFPQFAPFLPKSITYQVTPKK